MEASGMIAKLAIIIDKVASEFRDQNRSSKIMLLVSVMMPKFALGCSELGRTPASGH
jgi:hypothetical protein